jgi:microcystin-dependent protein
MADTYTSTLGTIVMGIGGDNNTWGTNLNNSVFQILEDAISNCLTTAASGGQIGPSNTLDLSANAPPAGPSGARYYRLAFTGAVTANQTVIVPNLERTWIVSNALTGGFTLSFKTPSGTPVVVPTGTQWVLCWPALGIFVSPYNWGRVQMPDGSAGSPAYSNANEPTSGWYRNGTQDWRLSINGSDVLQVTGAGAGTPSVMNLIAGALQVGGAQVVPAGVEAPYAGITAPTGWLFEFGQPISRPIANGGSVDTYKNLFAAITATATGNTHSNTTVDGLPDLRGLGLEGAAIEGTGIQSTTTIVSIDSASSLTLSLAATSSGSGVSLRILPFGRGDGSTTFNVPDRRGRSLFGRDNMGGTAASRITVNAGTHLSTTGGEETHTLVTGEMPVHSHGVTDPGHVHTVPIQSASQFSGGATFGEISSGAGNPNTSSATTGISINTAGDGAAHNTMPLFGITNFIIKM